MKNHVSLIDQKEMMEQTEHILHVGPFVWVSMPLNAFGAGRLAGVCCCCSTGTVAAVTAICFGLIGAARAPSVHHDGWPNVKRNFWTLVNVASHVRNALCERLGRLQHFNCTKLQYNKIVIQFNGTVCNRRNTFHVSSCPAPSIRSVPLSTEPPRFEWHCPNKWMNERDQRRPSSNAASIFGTTMTTTLAWSYRIFFFVFSLEPQPCERCRIV